MADGFQLIERDELKEKIDRGDDFVLVETLPESAFKKRHLPGAVNLDDMSKVSELFPDKDAEIVAYCTNFNWHASERVARELVTMGYTNVKEYPGGKQDWVSAGLPTESGA